MNNLGQLICNINSFVTKEGRFCVLQTIVIGWIQKNPEPVIEKSENQRGKIFHEHIQHLILL